MVASGEQVKLVNIATRLKGETYAFYRSYPNGLAIPF